MEATVRERPVGDVGTGITLLPVRVLKESAQAEDAAVEIPPLRPGMIHAELPWAGADQLESSVDPAMVRAVLRSLEA